MAGEVQHIPVMAREVQEYLRLPAGGCFVDCTLGLGGHSLAAARQVGVTGRLIGIDHDNSALAIAKEKLLSVGVPFDLINDDFRNLPKILDKLGISAVDGMLFDLGISSFQIDDPVRGFSLKADGPLDMRMNPDGPLSAYDLVNSLSEQEISLILRDYGEERWHNRIARNIVEQRTQNPIATTKELSDLVMRSMPRGRDWQKIHPATRTFQAFRIAVNRELESITLALDNCLPYLKNGARICVIAFHSLEDRIVKQKFREFARAEKIELITKKPLRPEEEEARQNPRARSARLRVAQKI